MKMTKAQFFEVAKSIGVAIVDDGDKIEIFAPTRKLLACGSHTTAWFMRSGEKRSEVYAMLVQEFLDAPLDPCDDPDCEACAEPAIPSDVERYVVLGFAK